MEHDLQFWHCQGKLNALWAKGSENLRQPGWAENINNDSNTEKLVLSFKFLVPDKRVWFMG